MGCLYITCRYHSFVDQQKAIASALTRVLSSGRKDEMRSGRDLNGQNEEDEFLDDL